MRALTLRWRLLGVALGLILVALASTIVILGVLLDRYLMTQARQELEFYGASVAQLQLKEYREASPALPSGFTLRLILEGSQEQISLGEAFREPTEPIVPLIQPDDPRIGQTLVLPSTDGTIEWLALPLTDVQGEATLVVALPLRQLNATVNQVLVFSSAIAALVLISCAVLGWYLIRRTFRPLTRIEDTAAAIAAGDLTQRVDVPDSEDEVASLSRSLNAMLSRIEHSFAAREANEEQMRRFIADASHELRTPLAAVSGYAELYRHGGLPSQDAVAGAMARIEDESHRMRALVEDLLTLARLDEDRPLELQTVDLAVLAAEAAQDAQTIAPDRVVTVRGIAGPLGPTELVADERQLRQVVTNLVTNARIHTPSSAPIEILVGPGEAGRVVLEVRDHGPGIPSADRPRVFERFYRADRARSRGGGAGSGLGLAIVDAIVAAHSGSVRVEDTPGGGATFIVDLPAH
ncbi:HAMP domain-containing histidine kinase [Intrasporangium calvum]|uniref:histidine kinase n=1 Tax=Intrasporangium calvum TaxID=53358 RepID=A0ABT5GHP5_9MICO|nr:HAMP domain-containing sensor histidine kinase [Intrasporangium calvum]MDC5697717.1 HAMP domain-containing histidine kinase [Intrasporangium calvum]